MPNPPYVVTKVDSHWQGTLGASLDASGAISQLPDWSISARAHSHLLEQKTTRK